MIFDEMVKELKQVVEKLGLKKTFPVFARPLPGDGNQNCTVMYVDITSRSEIPDSFFSPENQKYLLPRVKADIILSILSTIDLLKDDIKLLEKENA